MRFLFSYFNDLDPLTIGPDEIILYLNYLKTGLNLGRDKCRMLAQSCSFFYKHVLKKPYLLPSKLYPRKEFKLPEILSQQHVAHLYRAIPNIKHRCIIGILYGAGLRLNELRMLKINAVDSTAMHRYGCDQKACGFQHWQYHSCGNRHCPSCGAFKKEQWIEFKTSELLPTAYYHACVPKCRHSGMQACRIHLTP